MSSPTKRLVLIDGHSNLYKAYHGIKQSLTNATGEPTSAVYGFLNMFLRLKRELNSDYMVVVFDPPGGTFREEIFAEYKANRPPAPADLKVQEARVREMMRIMQVPVLEVPGFEADDVLACLALQAVATGGEALVCSSDKDLLQMIRPGIRIWREHLNKAELMDEAAVVAKLGVRPDQVAAYLGLVGDTSDNIPGVKGIGAKTAAELLQKYETMEGILAAAPGIGKKKLSESLIENAEVARLSERLATLKTDCVVDGFDWERFRWELKPTRELRDFYRLMDFQTQLNELGPPPAPERATNYRTVLTSADLAEVVAAIRAAGRCAIDTETNDLDPISADLVGLSLGWAHGEAAYIPVGHHSGDAQLSLAEVVTALNPVLSDPAISWYAHHWNFDHKILGRAGFALPEIAGDSMIAHYLTNPDRAGSLRLKDLALSRLGVKMTEIKELIGSGDDMVTMASVSIEDSSRYACLDADMTLQLHDDLIGPVRDAGMEDLYRKVELPLIPVISAMEMEGVRIDREWFRELSAKAVKELERMALEIFQLAGRSFNINSPKQVGELLFDDLKLPGGKKGKTGAYGTDVSVLEELEDLHPLPRKLLEYRGVEKLKNTYMDPLPGMVHPKTGRLHTSFNQTVAATGRLSSSNPNLQNIPIRTQAGREIRRGFVPRAPGWSLVAADYSQIELRILAHLSGDAALVEAFRSGGDVHTLTASKIFGIPPAEVNSSQRNSAKTINFGIIYGMGDFRLAKDLEISRETARNFIAEYFRVYSGIAAFLENTKVQARKDRFVTTLLGRRRFVPDINSSNGNQRFGAERVAMNTPIQGTSADMIKLAMIRVQDRLRREGFRAKMILQVHDELIFDCPDDEVARLIPAVQEEMANALPLSVPIKVEAEAGPNWAEC